MSGSVEIVLWLQEYKLQALEAQLARDGCSTEKLLQDILNDLYHRRVPLDIQREISERLDAEAAAELAERDANTTWAAYHITEHGDDQYFKTPTGMSCSLPRAVCGPTCTRATPAAGRGSPPCCSTDRRSARRSSSSSSAYVWRIPGRYPASLRSTSTRTPSRPPAPWTDGTPTASAT